MSPGKVLEDINRQLIQLQEAREKLIAENPGVVADPRTFESIFEDIFDGAMSTMINRQRKYGPGNIGRHGIQGIAVRLGDKLARLDNFVSGDATVYSDESITDTLMDILNYAAIGIAWLGGDWTKNGVAPLRENL